MRTTDILNASCEHFPDTLAHTLDLALCVLYVARRAVLTSFFITRLKQLKRHLFREAALIHLELGAYNYNASTRIVDALSKKVLPESSLLAAEHLLKRFELPVAGTRHGAAALAVIDERIDGFLKHSLFVSHYNVGSCSSISFF